MDKWTLRYQQVGNRTYWQIDGIDIDHVETRYCANGYASFRGWDFTRQCYGNASSPSGFDAKRSRAYFLRQLKSLADAFIGDDHYDRQRHPKFSVRRVTDLVNI